MLQRVDLERLFAYTVWANHRVMRVAATVSVEEFKRDLGSSHGGVRGTLAHMLGVEWLWLERFKGVSPTRMFDEAEFGDLVVLRDRWTVIEGHRKDWLASLREGDPAQAVRYRTTEGKAYEARLWELAQHVVNHSTYHRGQVVTLLRILGTRGVSTDLVTWDRERTAAR